MDEADLGTVDDIKCDPALALRTHTPPSSRCLANSLTEAGFVEEASAVVPGCQSNHTPRADLGSGAFPDSLEPECNTTRRECRLQILPRILTDVVNIHGVRCSQPSTFCTCYYVLPSPVLLLRRFVRGAQSLPQMPERSVLLPVYHLRSACTRGG